MASRFTTEQIQEFQAFVDSLPNERWKNFGDLENFVGLDKHDFSLVPLNHRGLVLTHWRRYQSLSFL
jgi:hypothetical protein